MRSGFYIAGAWLTLGLALLCDGPVHSQGAGEGEAKAAPETLASPLSSQAADAESSDALLSESRFAPEMRAVLQQGFDTRGRISFATGGNLTVLSVPDGVAVYLAAVRDIQAGGGPDPVVEAVLFQPERLAGETPLTLELPPGDYVVGLRAARRGDSFDGGCVRKATRDAITGGPGRAYHLYGISKRPGKYFCLLANFAPAGEKLAKLGLPGGGIFSADPEELAGMIASNTHVPAEEANRVAEMLQLTGRAFYEADGTAYYCRLGVEGTELTLQDWPVE